MTHQGKLLINPNSIEVSDEKDGYQKHVSMLARKSK